jgi:hypothetical protein
VIVLGYKLLGMALLESHKFEVNIALTSLLWKASCKETAPMLH